MNSIWEGIGLEGRSEEGGGPGPVGPGEEVTVDTVSTVTTEGEGEFGSVTPGEEVSEYTVSTVRSEACGVGCSLGEAWS